MTVPNLSAVASNVKGIMQPVTGQKDELPEGVRNIVDHKLYLAYNAFTPDATKTYYVTYGSRNYPVEYIKDWSAYLLLYLRIEQHD
jgi:hypothetical protein